MGRAGSLVPRLSTSQVSGDMAQPLGFERLMPSVEHWARRRAPWARRCAPRGTHGPDTGITAVVRHWSMPIAFVLVQQGTLD
ncbi:hypothetical protein TW86_00565 [Halomonas sp. S2151]|nr:hypothetical protein TW86_00565 [Halomonas sp. S2151]